MSSNSSRRRSRKRSGSTEANANANATSNTGTASAGTSTASVNASTTASESNANATMPYHSSRYNKKGKDVVDFQPSFYLLNPCLSKSNSHSHSHSHMNMTMYGLDVPPIPPENCCAACHGVRNHELKDDTVLLCDGLTCGREFHMQCVVPTVTEIPEDDWYCIDCSPTGSTALLRQYLEQNDERKADFTGWEQYRESLWNIDFQEDATVSPKTTSTSATSSTSSVVVHRRPKSELDRAFQSHELAMRPAEKGDGGSGRLSSRSRTPAKKARASSNNNNNNNNSSSSPGRQVLTNPSAVSVPERLTAANSLQDIYTTGEQHRHPAHFLGRPVRLYNPAGNTYHTGRIVDWRQSSSWSTTCTTNAPNTDRPSAGAEAGQKDKITSHVQARNVHVPIMKEYLVRFTAGMDDRKTSYEHWLTLEEHALAVGTSLIWGSFERDFFQPAILWLRTARELVPVQHLLNEDLGQILYEDSHVSLGSSFTASTKEAIILQWKRHTGITMARSYGDEQYQLLNLESESVDFFNADAQRAYGNTQEMKVLMALVLAEWHEQESVRKWHGLVRGNPVGSKILTSRDEYALGNLVPRNQPEIPLVHAAPCALVPRGLDRAKIMHMLERQGANVSKELASTLTVNVMSVDVAKYDTSDRPWRRSRDDDRKVASVKTN